MVPVKNSLTFVIFCLVTLVIQSCSLKHIQPNKNSSESRAKYEISSSHYVIATQGEASARAAKAMFELGGNAIDAAAAASFTIAVERPQSTGLGGGGFMLIYFAKEKNLVAVDFREKAPRAAKEKMFQDKKGEVVPALSTDGILSGAVPGTVAGILEIHHKYGKLTRQQVIQPAIDLADKGFPVYEYLANAIKDRKDVLAKYPSSAEIFLKPNGEPLSQGDLLVQKDLANTLRLIANLGKKGFYKGPVAKAVIAEETRLYGLIAQKDLDQYKPIFRKPLVGHFHGFDIYSMPPPSSGGIHIIEALNILERDDLKKLGKDTPEGIRLIASTLQEVFADRAKYLGDSDFIKIPIRGLISKKYASTLRSQILPNQARPSKDVKEGDPWAHESDDTTHFSIMDAEGNTISSTQTINGWMGSGIVVPGTGILLNNEMDDFSSKPGTPNMFGAIGGKENAISPTKRPLSSMSPTIVMKDGSPVLALGSPAGTRIISCVLETLLNYLEYELPLYESVRAPRFHHQWIPDEIQMEPDRFNSNTIMTLEKMGYKVKLKEILCRVQAVARQGNHLVGVADPRGPEDKAVGGDLEK